MMIEKLNWLTDNARSFLANGYIETSAEERYNEIAENFERISGIKGFGDKVRGYIEKHWVSFASPIISNFGNDKGLPASCNFLSIQDTLYSIEMGRAEMALLAKAGAGTARNFSKIRPKYAKYGISGKSVGVMSWIEEYESTIKKVTQGGVRRGFFTAYLSVEHPEIWEFLKIGTEGHPLQKMTTGVTIPDGWIDSMKAGDVEKQKLFLEIHRVRSEIGYPYILFEDNCNKGKAQVYIDRNVKLDTSNICTECIELSDEEKEFVCVLSSANLQHYNDWKDTNFIFDLNIMLDCVVTEYIKKAKQIKGLEKAVKFAKEHRSIGIGTLGFADLLQQENLAFGDVGSILLNKEIFRYIRSESDKASKWMAKEWGECPYAVGYGFRNTSRIAGAPTKSSSAIMGDVSQYCMPIKSNYHIKDLAKIQVEWKNPNLVKVLESKGFNNKEVWKSILINNGSVQHLDCLSDHEKLVFRNADEIPQMDVIRLYADRQPFIDQSQSLNLTIPNSATAKEIVGLTLKAHEMGIKTLYYAYSTNAAQNLNRDLLNSCTACSA